MVFLNPLFLWTLLGLSIPIAIHFWSKKKVKTIKIGSTQLLKEQNPKQTSSIRLNQWVLLILRLFILILIALIIAGPSIEYTRKDKNLTYIIEPSLLNLDKIKVIVDSIDDGEVRLLQPTFPSLEDDDQVAKYGNTPNYWQLAQQMEKLQTDSIIVFTKASVRGFKGMRPETKIPINWILIDEGEKVSIPVELVRKDEQIDLISLDSDYRKLSYLKNSYTLGEDIFYTDSEKNSLYIENNKEPIPLPLIESGSRKILLVYDDDFITEKWYINSAFHALSDYLELEIDVTEKQTIESLDLKPYDVLVWLRNVPLVPFEGKSLIFQLDAFASDLIIPSNSTDRYFLSTRLNAENSVAQNLPAQLLVLLNAHDSLKNKVPDFDQRRIGLDQIGTNENFSNRTEKSKSQKDMSSWLWAFLLCLLPVERVLSKLKKQ